MTIFNAQDPNQPQSREDRGSTLDLSQFALNDRSYQANRLIPDSVESLEPLRVLCNAVKQLYYKAHEIEIETAARLGADPADLRSLAPDVPMQTRNAACQRVMEFFEHQVEGHTGLFLDFGGYARYLDSFFEGELRTVVERNPGRKPFPVGTTPQVVTHNLSLITAEQAVKSENKEQREGCLKIVALLAEETQTIMPEVGEALQRMDEELKGKLAR